jgi:nitroreductase
MVMNDTIKTIMSRYSCREYSGEPVTDEELATVVEAGKHAPSAKNGQSWHFTVVRTEEGKRKALDALGERPDDPMLAGLPWPPDADFHGAPALIIVSGDKGARFVQDGVFVAAGYMMLAATSIGLATVWSTPFSKDMFRDVKSRKFKGDLVPEGYEPYVAFFIGHPADPEKTQDKPRKEGVVRYL